MLRNEKPLKSMSGFEVNKDKSKSINDKMFNVHVGHDFARCGHAVSKPIGAWQDFIKVEFGCLGFGKIEFTWLLTAIFHFFK